MRDARPDDRPCTLHATPLPPAFVERRARVRFRCERLCRTHTFITNTYRTLPARLVDVSPVGLGLVLGEPLPVGTRANVELDEGAAELPLEMLVEISNVTAETDGSWRCGCALIWRITEDEMWALLKSSSPAKPSRTQPDCTE